MHDYVWTDVLFAQLINSDPLSRRQWDQVPYLYCKAKGQAHMLVGAVQEVTLYLKQILYSDPPYVLKLSYHSCPDKETSLILLEI